MSAFLLVAVAWLGTALLSRRRPPLAVLSAVLALSWLATPLLPLPVTWHRGVLVHLLLAGSTWLPASWTARAAVGLGYLAALTGWPWVWSTTAVALATALVAAAAVEAHSHRVTLLRLRPWRAATVVGAVALATPPLLGVAGLPRTWAGPVEVGYAAALVLVAALVVLASRPGHGPWATDLAVDLGAQPRDLLEAALAVTRGDPADVVETARQAAAAARNLQSRLEERHRELAVLLDEVARSRDRLDAVDRLERLALRRAIVEGPAVHLREVVALLGVEVGSSEPGAGSDPVRGPTVRALHHLRLAMVELDGLSHGLGPVALDDGLVPALGHLADRCPVPVALELPEDRRAEQVPSDVAACVYYVAAEALANVVKHSGAERVLVRLRVDGDVELVVVDDGVGGIATCPGGAMDGLNGGLDGLRARARELAGDLVVTSPSGQGTRIHLRVPVTTPARAGMAP